MRTTNSARPVEKSLDVLKELLAAQYATQDLVRQRVALRPGSSDYRLTIIMLLLAYIAYIADRETMNVPLPTPLATADDNQCNWTMDYFGDARSYPERSIELSST